jgi:hypothetical protein
MRHSSLSIALIVALIAALMTGARAQVPGTVNLAKVKIPETQKSDELCPVHLKPSDPRLLTWTHEGVVYRGCEEGDQSEFLKTPNRYLEPSRRQRWINNFMQTMSTIWCPVTDQLTPGNFTGWKRHGLAWEVCCQFCEESIKDDDIDAAFERLKTRAAEAYTATGGRYQQFKTSPVEDAIVP